MPSRTLGLQAFKRYLTLRTGKIRALPIVILMPHSSCNCRCVMCDIWLGNGRPQQLTEADISGLLTSFRELDTQWVVMSGGEALLNPNLFQLCKILKGEGLKLSILSTGLLLKKFAPQVVAGLDEVIVSLDGSQNVHDAIRRVPRAFERLREGVQVVKGLKRDFLITGRCVIQRGNYADWPNIVDAARDVGLDQISFLAADISTEAFNRPELWDGDRRSEVLPTPAEVSEMGQVLEKMIDAYAADFASSYIAESPDKLRRIVKYYSALHGQSDFPTVECNAPWVSAVVEADGTVRPCYFHRPMGNIRQTSLPALLNGPDEIAFRQRLDMASDPTCRKCVCTLNLRPTIKVT